MAVERAGLIEGVHHGRFVLTGPDGAILAAHGAVTAPMYPRSSNKPMQAIGMLRAGLDLDGELLALAAASHDGEAFHLEGVRRILAGVDLDLDALQTTAGLPLNEAARADWIREHGDPAPWAMNCSGKHAAMVRTCVRAGWDPSTYLEAEHPLQQQLVAAVGELAGEPVATVAVDGCGAPLAAISLAGLARAFGRIAAATEGPEHQLAEAYRKHPEWASGTTRGETALHRAVPGLVTKAGAEAVYAAGLPDGRGLAVKINDGGSRASQIVLAQALVELGHDDPEVVARTTEPVLGHGRPVGTIASLVDALTQ